MPYRLDTDVPYGNACDIAISADGGVPVVSFAASPHGGPETLWFRFRLAPIAPLPAGSRLKLVLKHADNMLGGHDPSTMRPVMRPAGGDWARLGPGTAERLPDGRLQACWLLDAPEGPVDIAFCYPYGVPDVEALLRETQGYWHADTIGISQQDRPLLRLSNSYGEVDSTRPGLYLIARQHSGETPGSWVLDGFLRQLATLGEAAPLVWAVPLSNIDGVEQGDYGKDNFPYDLNRAWGRPPMRHETLVFQQDMRRWQQRCRPALALDFHAPGACEAQGIYCYVPAPEKHPDRHALAVQWTDRFARALSPRLAAAEFARVARYPSRWELPNFSRYCFETLSVCGIGIETPYALAGDTLLTREVYQDAGRRLAAEIADIVAREAWTTP